MAEQEIETLKLAAVKSVLSRLKQEKLMVQFIGYHEVVCF